MEKKKLPKSIRKYIRKEKARIRREILDFQKQKELINQLYQKFYPLDKSAFDQRHNSAEGGGPRSA